MGYYVKQAGQGAPGAVQLWGERARAAERTGVSSSAREARTMIIDDRLLPQTGASGERDGSGSETLAPGWDELAALAGESETDHHPATPAADNSEANVDSPLGIYFRDIARIPLLTAEQEVQLAQALERGVNAAALLDSLPPGDLEELARLERDLIAGEAARRKLMESNLRLVVSVARRYLGRGLPFSDLIQEGSLGLSRAVEKFDYRRGFKFSTYAYWWIRQAVTRAIANQSRTIRVPVHMIDQIGHVYSTFQRLQQRLGHDPRPEDVALELGLPVEKVREAFRASANPISLETPVGSDEENTLGDLLANHGEEAPADVAERTLLSDYLDDALQGLTARERMVLRMRFGISDQRPRTLGEIGQMIGVSRERVRQLEAEAIAKLRRPSLRRRLAEYLE
jgi:RNA polymerase primary sigma factor